MGFLQTTLAVGQILYFKIKCYDETQMSFFDIQKGSLG